MGLQLFNGMPAASSDLVSIENLPIVVTPSAAFHEAKAQLLEIVSRAGTLANAITTDLQYNDAISSLQSVKRFKKDLTAGADPSKKQLNSAKDALMALIHELEEPATNLELALSAETARYFQDKERRRREEEDCQRREAELERQRLQREADLNALRDEISTARQTADAADLHGQPETAKEIRAGLKRFAALDAAPGGYRHPLQDATEVRQAVALAIQREQALVAADKARQEGATATARAIERAAAKLTAPEVAPVVSERVEAASVLVPRSELAHAKGSYVKEVWRARIIDPAAIPREFCEPSESLLNDLAKRLGERARVPGVVFEKVTKMAGVRA